MSDAPFRQQFDAAMSPLAARNALGITNGGGGGGVPTTRLITAGAGLAGGGDLSADRTLDVGAGTGITVNANDVALTVPVAVANGGTGATTAATALSNLGGAPLASPTFTGDPKAPTPTAGDNDTSIATTAFVTAAVAAAATSTVGPPQGRLTLVSSIPVMGSTVTGATTIYYTRYGGGLVPIYDGTNFVMTSFTELSCLLSDTTKNPAAIAAVKVNDWFVWNDAGTIRLSHGPDWTDDTTRSAGNALIGPGIWRNSVAITNGPAASRGTYVGTTRSDTGAGTISYIFGGLAAGGTPGWFGVWNVYNRVDVKSQVRDDTNTWTYAVAATPRSANGSNNMRCSYICGLAEDCFFATYQGSGNTGTSFSALGIGYDSTTAFSGSSGVSNSGGTTANIPSFGSFTTPPAIGFHYLQAMETQHAGTGTFFGDANFPLEAQNGLTVMLRM